MRTRKQVEDNLVEAAGSAQGLTSELLLELLLEVMLDIRDYFIPPPAKRWHCWSGGCYNSISGHPFAEPGKCPRCGEELMDAPL